MCFYISFFQSCTCMHEHIDLLLSRHETRFILRISFYVSRPALSIILLILDDNGAGMTLIWNLQHLRFLGFLQFVGNSHKFEIWNNLCQTGKFDSVNF